MDRNDEYEIIQMIDRILWMHTSHVQDTHNENLPIDERMHIGEARRKAMEEFEEWMVKQLRDAHRP